MGQQTLSRVEMGTLDKCTPFPCLAYSYWRTSDLNMPPRLTSSNSLVQSLQEGRARDNMEFKGGILFFKGNIYLSASSPLTSKILSMIHHECHEGYQKTLHRIARDFYWPGMKRGIQDFVHECIVCQRNKVEQLKPVGLSLPVPHQVWSDISMDFIIGLPRSQGKTILFVVVDRFSKHSHIIPLAHPFTAVTVARVLFAHIFKLHGLPETIVSDRDALLAAKKAGLLTLMPSKIYAMLQGKQWEPPQSSSSSTRSNTKYKLIAKVVLVAGLAVGWQYHSE